MPNFGNPLTGIGEDHTLTKEELARAVRFLVAAEYEAVEMYEKVRDATDDGDAKKVIQSIIDEEKVHAGEFLKLLAAIDPKETEFYEKGYKEVSEQLEESKKAFGISDELDRIASEVEPQDRRIALALDSLSDAVECSLIGLVEPPK